ncbi:VOC family protein [Streptomyces sp. DSM 42041]|uniref:VOC family protein n=1 Tax=Streptomyces hazeniae TaxID=3075538 RepID=A0ABU2NN12_9ACTN|nr:VOC family protein [Streptomyces sp. DSM 42041]MDT0378374.1 VOC family protein [Streptomyces sp. DSM 42041]
MTQTVSARQRRQTPGTPCWASLMVRDLDRSRDFYQGLFGWEFTAGPQQLGPYVRAVLDGREVAGLGETPAGRRFPAAWTPYLASDDADETAGLIRLCGGTVAVGPLDFGDTGRLVVAADPGGAAFGVWQSDEDTGLQVVENAPGTPVWFELLTHTTAGPGAFYPSVFGYGTEPDPDGDEQDRLTLLVGDRPVATVRGTDGARPSAHGPHWKTCFAVRDAEDTVRRARELGGRLVREPHPTPYGVRATVADAEGAEFSVREQPGAAGGAA